MPLASETNKVVKCYIMVVSSAACLVKGSTSAHNIREN